MISDSQGLAAAPTLPPSRFLEGEFGGRRLGARSGRDRINESESERSTCTYPRERAALGPLGGVIYLFFTESTPSLTFADRIRNEKPPAYARIPLRKVAIS